MSKTDLDQYRAIGREPVRAKYRGREVLANPPPSAGGILLIYALDLLMKNGNHAPSVGKIVEVMQTMQAERTWEFLEGLAQANFAEKFFSSRLGSTTHISVLDDAGWACSVTCSNGEGAGIVIPGTGIHINNMMGEEDLNPHGFHLYKPGRRMPSMMCPTIVLSESKPELVLGSGGSNRIRSAILQTIINVVDRGLSIQDAVILPRLHFENNIVYVEPGIDTGELEHADLAIARFRELNLFFGGVHGVERNRDTGELSGGGDPRRGGVTLTV